MLGLINKLGNNTSYGNDKIDALTIKTAAAILYKPITHVINCSISNSEFIAKWKIGRLLPLFKGKGLNTQDPESYRPISLLPVLSKLTERAIQHQILNYMKETRQINEKTPLLPHRSFNNHSNVTTL